MEIRILNHTADSDLFILTGSSIQTARSNSDGPVPAQDTITKLVYYPDKAYVTFKRKEGGEFVANGEPLSVSFRYVQATGTNLVTESGRALPVIEEMSLAEVEALEEQ